MALRGRIYCRRHGGFRIVMQKRHVVNNVVLKVNYLRQIIAGNENVSSFAKKE